MAPHLTSTWVAGDGNGSLRLHLDYTGTPRHPGDRLCVATQLFPLSPAAVSGADLVGADGSFHEIQLPDGHDRTLEFVFHDLAFTPRHVGEGPRSAYLLRSNGATIEATTAPMRRDPQLDTAPQQQAPTLPHSGPFCLPWPNHIDLAGTCDTPVVDFSGIGETQAAIAPLAEALHLDISTCTSSTGQGVRVSADGNMPEEGFCIRFEPGAISIEVGPAGTLPAIATLLQLLWGAQNGFGFPAPGSVIEDEPAFHWRGFHLDCARHFFSVEEIERVLAVMALLKLNRFHWHLTDDEAWRPEIEAFPDLARIGGIRGPGHRLSAQFEDGDHPHAGSYSRADMLRVVATARLLGIEVMPEVDLPGHSTAMLRSLPHLADPKETPGSYRSVQNFANNSLNPAVPGVVDTVEEILEELLEIFPYAYMHLGGDELPTGAWAQSPMAQTRASKDGLTGVSDLQRPFFRGIQTFLDARGRSMAVWDEQGRTGNTGCDALVFCWQDAQVAGNLTRAGYPVVVCPAQACYLDIAPSADWFAPGSGWAGVVTLHDSYHFDPLAGVAAEHSEQVVGVQACLWTEMVPTWHAFEQASYPRLFAVAETGWTRSAHKDFGRFASLSSSLQTALRAQRD